MSYDESLHVYYSWLGRLGALAASALVLISPYVLYYSRYIRHDIQVFAWTLLAIVAIFRLDQPGRAGHRLRRLARLLALAAERRPGKPAVVLLHDYADNFQTKLGKIYWGNFSKREKHFPSREGRRLDEYIEDAILTVRFVTGFFGWPARDPGVLSDWGR